MERKTRSPWLLVAVVAALVLAVLGAFEILAPEPRFPDADPF